MDPIRVSDLKVIVTGGARGIGAATARLLAADGARVMITDILDEEGNAVAAEIGGNAAYRHHDVTDDQAWAETVAAAEEAFGGVNALFNNAGIVHFASVLDTAPDDFRRVVDINLTGVFLGIRATAPAMARAGGGTIVNTSSTAGLKGYGGLAAYVASKWGVRGITKGAALDLATDRVRVLSLHPGPIRTPMTEGLGDDTAGGQPIPRFGEPDEVARMVRFMFCEGTYSTGSEFIVDGGAVTG
ncbi:MULTISPECIES: SDR family NAD(P)-dependent oxidoreductase [unclassified Roseitalea]|uniref:SDR family NAD(P)-dependent oxidoreductase n=1 Tax=unclassified Roseitalea TaxID=2639107 RepID=UPI00273E64AD|nr:MULTISPECIES: SDR family NAD(P)-dependent oxidoreductase [unclassified Roseitalea]